VTLIFISLNSFTCREQDPSIPEQFEIGHKELRDLDSYIDVICSTQIKTNHWFVYFVQAIIICILLAYGFILKIPLTAIKQKYYLLHQKPDDDFKNVLLKRKHLDKEKLVKELKIYIIFYFLTKIIVSIFIAIALVLLIFLKYSLPSGRDLFLPYENKCGPHLFWNETDEDDDIGEYYCHFKAEWTVFMLLLWDDIYSLGLLVIMAFQLVHLCFIVYKTNVKSKIESEQYTFCEIFFCCCLGCSWDNLLSMNPDTNRALGNDFQVIPRIEAEEG